VDLLEAAQHSPNFARTVCNRCGEHWPCPPWAEALAETERSHDDRQDEHPYVHAEHCASCALGRPGRPQ